MVRFDTACINTDFWENKKYGRYYPGLPYLCFVDTGSYLQLPKDRDRKSSVSNRFGGGLYYPVAVITPASPIQVTLKIFMMMMMMMMMMMTVELL